jgi:hypothetical protein
LGQAIFSEVSPQVTVASTDAWAVCERDLRVREFDALPPFARALVDTLLAH